MTEYTKYKGTVRLLLSRWAKEVRGHKGWRQQKMAEALRVGDRAYSDLEHGKYCFSAIPLLFLLLVMTPGQRDDMLKEFAAMVSLLEDMEVV